MRRFPSRFARRHARLTRLAATVPLLALVLASLATAPTARADVIIDNSPAATHGTNGVLVFSGAGTAFTVTAGLNLDTYSPAVDDLLIGFTGVGSLTVTNGASVFVPGTASSPDLGGTLLGFGAGSHGTLTVSDGGTLSTLWLQLGTDLRSTGTLTVTGTGSTVTTGDYGIWMFTPTSTATLSNGGSLNTTTGTASISGGALTVASGSQLTTANFTLDTSANPQSYLDAGLTDPGAYSATTLVTGAGTNWTNSGNIDLYANSAADTVSLTVTDHATVNNSGYLSLGSNTALTISQGATLNNGGAIDVGTSSALSLSSGAAITLGPTDPRLTINGTATITGAGTTFTATTASNLGAIDVGGNEGADASLTIADGAQVAVNRFAAYGFASGDSEGGYTGNGTVLVTGNGTALTVTGNSGTFISQYALTVTDHATVTTNRYISLDGTATISAGGTLASTYAGNTLNYLNGTTTVTGAGSAFSTATNTAIRSDGTLTVTDHATFTVATNLQVGNNSAGSLVVSDGGTVNTHGAVIGYYVNATASSVSRMGSATVTGTGSSWTNTGFLTLGSFRNADLTIADGGVLTNIGDVRIGANGSSTARITATALVTGAGSQLSTNGSLTIGFGGSNTSTLTIADHGRVTAASTVVNALDTLAIGSFGTLDTNALTVTNGGTLLLHSQAVLAYDLTNATATSWTFNAGSTLTIDPGATVFFDFAPASDFVAGTYTLLTFDPAAALNGVDTATFATRTGIAGYDFTYTLSGSALQVTAAASAIPEPSTYALLASGAALLLAAARRRRTA